MMHAKLDSAEVTQRHVARRIRVICLVNAILPTANAAIRWQTMAHLVMITMLAQPEIHVKMVNAKALPRRVQH